AVSADGHPISGEFLFTATADVGVPSEEPTESSSSSTTSASTSAATSASTDDATATSSESEEGLSYGIDGMKWPIIIVAGAAVIAALVALILKRRKPLGR